MRSSITIVAMSMAAILSANAADLFITVDEKSFWVSSFSQQGKTLTYQTREGGPKKIISTDNLDIVVPSVKRGRKYTPEQIEKGLARAKRAIARHPRLRKQIELLKQQWEALGSGKNEGIPGEIQKLQGKFEMSDKAPKTFQDIGFQLQMLKFKDAAGQHAAAIDEAMQAMKSEVFTINMPKLQAMAGAGRQTLENYNTARKLGEELKMIKATEDEKETINQILERCRRNTVAESLRLAKAAFFGSKKVGGYLKSMSILGDVEYSEAPKDADKNEIRKVRAIIRSSAAKQLSGYKLNERGYPLERNDLQHEDRFSRGESGYAHGKPEHCLLVPTKSLGGKKTGDSISIPLTLVFNREPLVNTDYYLMGVFSVPGSSRRKILEEPIPIGRMKNGRLRAEFSATVPWLEPEFHDREQREAWNNTTYFRLLLVYKGYRTPFSEQKDWVAASGECGHSFRR